jgi:hypothetical protein
MSEVVTSLVIDADVSGADKFTQAMAGAEQAASSGTASLGGWNLGLIALGAGAIAAVEGIKQVSDYVISANKALADMQTVSHQVGLTLTDFQGIQFGGAVAGMSTDQINSGLEKSAALLNDASRNSNSLSKELEANGLSVKNTNGQLISENQLLGIAADLIKNANNPGDALAIAQMLGFTKEWIPLLEQGSGAMSQLGTEAQAAGAVIDDATIQKAAAFDAEWRKSSVEFSSYMKAAMAELLPIVDDLIVRAAKFAKSFSKSDIQSAADSQLKAGGDAVGVPDSAVIHIDADPMHQALMDWQNNSIFSAEAWTALGRAFSQGVHLMTPDQASQSIPGYAAGQITEPSYPDQAAMDAAFDKANPANPGSRARPLAGLSASDYAAGGGSAVAAKDTSGDAVDRAINSLTKHTEQQLADTQAVGLGDAALAGFKAEAAETAAVLANGGKETDAQVDKFSDLKDAAMAAADALAKAKVSASIDFAGKTAFLSADDVAIANQLKGIYGNDVPAALASTEAAAIRVNTAFKSVSTAIESGLTTGLTDIVSGTKSVSQGFTEMGNAIVKAIEQMIIKLTIVEPLMKALQGGASSLGLGGFSGAVNADGSIAGALGPTSVGGGALVGLHGGGIVGSEATFTRYVHPAHFNDAPRFHTGGIAGDEVPIIARKGEGVFTAGQMAALGGGSAPQITIHNHTEAQPQVSTGSNGDVTITLKKAIDGAVGDSMSSGSGMRVLSKQYGIKPFAGQ